MFTGLSAFPLTPLADDTVDERAFAGLIERLAHAGVDSITALGSTGSYAYLTLEERARAAHVAVQHAGNTPVFVGVGALRTSHVLENIRRAENAGASGVLLAPMTYQPLTDNDVFQLFRAATAHSELPVVVYDNPGTTHFTFTPELYGRIAELPGIASIKIPGVSVDLQRAREHVNSIRTVVPPHITIGISGDAVAAT
ncbi:MAG: dihydrodipicolinate synthase family protein, partial [Leucobacter sp.]